MPAAALKPMPSPPIIAAEPANTIAILVDQARWDRERYDIAIMALTLIYARAMADVELQRKLKGDVLGTLDYLIKTVEGKCPID